MGKTFTLSVIRAMCEKDKVWWEKYASDTWIYNNKPHNFEFAERGVISFNFGVCDDAFSFIIVLE
jgi:hypothetical protein